MWTRRCRREDLIGAPQLGVLPAQGLDLGGDLTLTTRRAPVLICSRSTQFRSVAGLRSSSAPTWRRAASLDSPRSRTRSMYILPTRAGSRRRTSSVQASAQTPYSISLHQIQDGSLPPRDRPGLARPGPRTRARRCRSGSRRAGPESGTAAPSRDGLLRRAGARPGGRRLGSHASRLIPKPPRGWPRPPPATWPSPGSFASSRPGCCRCCGCSSTTRSSSPSPKTRPTR